MKLQKVYIENFRGIKKLFLDFQGKTNLLIGENDCCKTTILEAVDLCFNGKLGKEDLYNLNLSENNNAIICCVFDENIKYDASDENLNAIVHKTHIKDGDEEISQDKFFLHVDDINEENLVNFIKEDKNLIKIQKATEKTPAVRQKDVIYYMSAIDLYDPPKSLEKIAFEKMLENFSCNNEEIKKILIENNHEKELNQTVGKILNEIGITKILKDEFEIENINYDPEGSRCFLKPSINFVRKYGDKQSEDLSHVGSGVKKIVKFIKRLKFDISPKLIFLIDEPEQNLHPKFQNSLIKFLGQEKVQCIFTSHSPTFVKHCMNDEDCNVLICEKDEKGEIKVKNIREKIETKYKFLVNHTNLQAVANFLAFGEYSTDLHNFLYGLLDNNVGNCTDFDKEYFKDKKTKKWKKQYDKKPCDVSLPTYIRHSIHHPENDLNEKFSYEELEQSIDKMIELLKKQEK